MGVCVCVCVCERFKSNSLSLGGDFFLGISEDRVRVRYGRGMARLQVLFLYKQDAGKVPHKGRT